MVQSQELRVARLVAHLEDAAVLARELAASVTSRDPRRAALRQIAGFLEVLARVVADA